MVYCLGCVTARQGEVDHIVVESTGVSEPLPVAQTFSAEIKEGIGGAAGTPPAHRHTPSHTPWSFLVVLVLAGSWCTGEGRACNQRAWNR
eukprot:COSAG01_NODE_275_length_19669_cov_8.676188_4_plen_90_part_00